jgi:hypothetical protein
MGTLVETLKADPTPQFRPGQKYAVVDEIAGVRVYGSANKFGHRMGYDPITKKTDHAHRLIYERAYGPIPKGWDVHHIDGDHLNNDPRNLSLVPHGIHVKIHRGYFLKGGVWHKRCTACGSVKPVSEFRTPKKGKDWHRPECRECHNRAERERYAKRRRGDVGG